MLGQRPWKTLGQCRLPSAAGGWSPRDGVGLLNLNGVLFMLGGWNNSGSTVWTPPSYTTSEVLRSNDLGKTWVSLGNAPWEKRHSAGYAVHQNKLWIVGGDVLSGHYQRDVWSSPDGVNWTQVTANAAPLSQGRALHQVFVHDGKLWIIGGQTLDEFTGADVSSKPGGPYYDDVWSSVDGADWTLVSSGHLWAPRASIIGNAVKDGYMWLVGGGAYDTEGNPRVYKNDVWRSANGVTWTQVTASGGFPARQYNSVAVCGEDLVVTCGWNGANIGDAWASKDGAVWRELGGLPYAARHAAGICNHNAEVYLLGGPLDESATWAIS